MFWDKYLYIQQKIDLQVNTLERIVIKKTLIFLLFIVICALLKYV